jgi:hypothetical protein
MPYITYNKLSNTLDVPINLPATEIDMGDWLLIATVQVTAPAQLTYRVMNLNFLSSDFALANIASQNLIVPNFGLCYVGLFYNYTSGDPSTLAALDVLSSSSLGVTTRTAAPLIITTPGTYSWIAVNNVQYSSQNSLLGTTDSADFVLSCVGQSRLELDLS